MEYTYHYVSKAEREAAIGKCEAKGHRMKHDNWDPDYTGIGEPHGTLVITDANPPAIARPDVQKQFDQATLEGKVSVLARMLGLRVV